MEKGRLEACIDGVIAVVATVIDRTPRDIEPLTVSVFP